MWGARKLQTRVSLSSTSCFCIDQVLRTVFDDSKGSLGEAFPKLLQIYFRDHGSLHFKTTRDFSFEGYNGALSSSEGGVEEGMSEKKYQ